MTKRLILFVLVLSCLFSTAAGVAETTFTMAGYDGASSSHDWNTNAFFTRMEARTGLSFTLEQYTAQQQWQAAKDAMLAGTQAMPDALFKAALTPNEQQLFYAAGRLIDLKPLLEENAPNLWALLQEHPDWMEAISLPTGEIVALPLIQTLPGEDAMWINQKWLDTLHLEMPTDMESLRNVLTAFKTQDPNGNGKADEVPFAFIGSWELKLFSHLVGVTVDDYNLYLDDEGTVHFWPAEDSFYELLQYLRELYRDGLLDQNGFSTIDSLRTVTDSSADIVYGAFFAPTPMNLLPYDCARDYSLLPPLSYDGKQVYRQLYGPVRGGTFAISSTCGDPAALLRWVDVLYTEEGGEEAIAGIAEQDYFVDDEGGWKWNSELSESYSALSELTIYDTGAMPLLFPTEFYNRYADEGIQHFNKELALLREYAKAPFAHGMLTPQQRETAMGYQAKLGAWVDTLIGSVVIGDITLDDAKIASCREELQALGVDEMLAFWQEIADR